tara:strand:+ start:24053 stop:24739 length:687 start_codon:yes stop_codon:yes gene_type:complete
MLIPNKFLSIILLLFLPVLSLSATVDSLQPEDVTIIAPKFIIGNNQKYQAQVKNVIINRFTEIFEVEIPKLEDQRVVTEFFDYTCGHCKNMAKILNEIGDARKNVSFIYKQFPIRGDKARLAARAAIASKAQNHFPEFHKLLMQNQPINKKTILTKADSLNLDLTQLAKDMESTTTYTEISDNYGLAQALKITGTPTFLILGQNSDGKPHIYYVAGILDKKELEILLR